MIRDVLSKQSTKLLLEKLDARSYKQVIRSKSKATDTIILTQQEFLNCLGLFTEVKLEEHDVQLL